MTVKISEMTATFNDATINYTGIGMNVNVISAGANSKLLDLQVNGNSVFSVNSTGHSTGLLLSGFYPEQSYYYDGLSLAWRDQPLQSSANLAVMICPKAASFSANMVGSYVQVTKTAQVGALYLALNKNGTLVANIAFAAGTKTSTINSTAFSVVAGDVLTLTSPAAVTAVGLAYTFIGV